MENLQKAPLDLMTSHSRLLAESAALSLETRKQGFANEFPTNMLQSMDVAGVDAKDDKKCLVGARKRKAQKVLKHKVLSTEIEERQSPESERIPVIPQIPNQLDMRLTLCHYADQKVNRYQEKNSDASRASDSELSSFEGEEFRRRSESEESRRREYDDNRFFSSQNMAFTGDQLSVHRYLYNQFENMEPGYENGTGAFRTLQRMQEYSRLIKSATPRVKEEPKDLADIPSILSVTSAVTKQNNSPQSFDSAIASPESFPEDSQPTTKQEDGDSKEEEGDCDPYAGLLRDMKLRGEFPCRLCDMVFPNLRALKGHNRVHLQSPPYQCNMCPTSSSDKSALIRHMRTHNGDRPFECRVCQFAFTTKANCERHLRNLHGKKNREELRAAIIFHTNEEVPPPALPPPPVAVKKEEKRDFKLAEKYNYRCTLCSSVISEAKLREHLSVYHFNFSPDFHYYYQKIRPDVEISLVQNVTDKMDYLGKMPRLEPAETAAVKALVDFAKELPKPAVVAPPKPQPFTVYEDPQVAPLDLSVKSTTPPVKSEQSAPAPLFPFPFFMNPYVKNWDHLSPAQWPAPLDMSTFAKPVSVPATTPVQSIPSPSKSPETTDDGQDVRLVMKNGILVKKQKQRRYRTERPFECEFCNGRFTLRSNMERHAKQQHPEAWNARMKGKVYESFKSSPTDGDEHESSGEESDDNLVVDENFRHLEAPPHYSEGIPSLEKLMELTKNRMFTEEKEQEKTPIDKKKSAYSNAPHRVTCPYCPRRFPWTSSLRRHILTHTGQKPFKCNFCPLWFTTKSNCDRHLARKHGTENDKKRNSLGSDHRLSSDDAESRCSSPSSGELGAFESVFACHLCSETFNEQHGVIEHIRVHHVEEFQAILVRQETLSLNRVSDSESPCGSQDEDSESSHEEEPLRRVTCAFCPRSYWSISQLRRHMLHHNGAQPHVCAECGKCYVLRRSLLSHIEKRHEEAMDLTP